MPGLNDTSATDMPPPALSTKRKYANGPGGSLAASASTMAGQTPEARKAKADALRLTRQALPIWSGKEAIVDAVQNNETVILLAETGSGKTTQVPQFLYEAGLTNDQSPLIGITQPRRVAATSLARRVACEMGEPDPGLATRPGKGAAARRNAVRVGKVGYAIRFEDRTGPDMRLRFMTDGLLLREIMGRSIEKEGVTHSLLERYAVLIIDEAHERTVDTDLLLGLVKRIQQQRREAYAQWSAGAKNKEDEPPLPLKVVVMSATLDAEVFADFFAPTPIPPAALVPAPVLYVQGRQHKVRLFHAEESHTDWTRAARTTIFQLHTTLPPGDILVFGTGAEEIESLRADLERLDPVCQAEFARSKRTPMSLLVVPLYAALGAAGIARAFETTPPGHRKVVLATNIAETSITLPGVRYVIDCGLAKEREHSRLSSSHGTVSTLRAGPISRSAADQRTGRAGREADGMCYRLYPVSEYKKLNESTIPEIQRADLTALVLTVYAMGLNPHTFHWISPPATDEISASIVALAMLGAIDPNTKDSASSGFKLSDLGRRMAALPLPPHLACTLLTAANHSPTVARQARDLVAILSSDRGSVLYTPSNAAASEQLDGKTGRGGKSQMERAEDAHAKLAHRSGDHATQLNALYAYLEARKLAEAAHATLNGAGAGSTTSTPVKGKKAKASAAAAVRNEVKTWCEENYISQRAVTQVLDIRKQLHQLCRTARIVCDDDQPPSSSTTRNGAATPRTSSSEEEEDEEESSADASGLWVRKGGNAAAAALEQERLDEDYAELRKCLLKGKMMDYGLRQADGSYQRPSSSDMTFRIHPSSALVARKPEAILYEELVCTTQFYARTVSAIEPAWIEEISRQMTAADTTLAAKSIALGLKLPNAEGGGK